MNMLTDSELSKNQIFKEVGDTVCTNANNVYLVKKNITEKDMEILISKTEKSITSWRHNKILNKTG